MGGKMSSRERMLAAIAREPVDYVPCSRFFNPLQPITRTGHRWQFPWPEGTSRRELITYPVERLGTDPIVGMGFGAEYPQAGVEARAWVDGDVLHKTWTTPSGDLHAAVRYNDLWPHGRDIPFYSDFNIGHFVEPWIETEADLACLRHILRSPEGEALDRVRSAAAETKALADEFGLATTGGDGKGLTGAMQLFGASQLCMMTIEQPDLVDAYLQFEHQLNLRHIELLGKMGADIIARNGFYETADFYGPDMLERFIGGLIRAEADAARQAGMVTWYTVHTGIMPILDYLAGLTVECLFGTDMVFHDMDLPAFRDKLAATKSFWLGPSSTFHVWKGPEPTREAVRRVFEVFGKTGLILAPCVSFHSIMPWESALAMIDEWKKLR